MQRWGHEETVPTALGPIRCRVAGDGPLLLFVHGALVDGRLWDGVAPRLAERFRVACPDLPLGAHREPVPDRSRLVPDAIADVLLDLADALGSREPILVGNDTGGALVQVAMSRRPERIAGAVLVSCDAFENFPPALFRPVVRIAPRVPVLLRLFPLLFGTPAMTRKPLPLWLLARNGLPAGLVRSWAEPLRSNPAIREDMRVLLRSVAPEVTLAAARTFPTFSKPVLVAWAREDKFFPPSDAERLAHLLPDATLRWIEGTHTFVPMDQPEALASAIEGW
ncbi:MAG: alpha/beta fold hydrolase, partial [Alphaproteobacteria bacterium]